MRLHQRLAEIFPKDKKQNEIARLLNVGNPVVTSWLKGDSRCGRPHLARIVEEFVPGDREHKKHVLCELFVLLQSERVEYEDADKWTESTKRLAIDALQHAHATVKSQAPQPTKSSKRSLCDFPTAFYPMAVISGDKREDSPNRITVGDFGTVSASPCEARWLLSLGLRGDVEFFGDKIFVSETIEQLKDRFAEKSLLVIGSPASNHLARRLLLRDPLAGWRRAVPVFRFNFDWDTIRQIEEFLKDLVGKNEKQLVGIKGDPETEPKLAHWLKLLFTGGIIDPTYGPQWTRGDSVYERDFGLVTVARNPFSDAGDKHVCILAAGFHLFGTAHAIKMLSKPAEAFSSHPLGGVLRIDYPREEKFATRFDRSTATWDNEDRSAYTIDKVIAGLKELQRDVPTRINISPAEISECLDFIDSL